MSCNCKEVKNGKDIDGIVTQKIEKNKLTFYKKIVISLNFIEFYFYFVTSSVLNLMFNDKLEPKIPKWLIKKYNKY